MRNWICGDDVDAGPGCAGLRRYVGMVRVVTGFGRPAANWVGDQVPVSTDDVLFDNSVLAGSYSVTLPSGNISVSVNTLVMTPTGTAIITLINPTSNTSPTAFAATGPGDAVVNFK